MATPFCKLVEYGQRIGDTMNPLALPGLAAELLKSVEPDEVQQTAYLITGQALFDARAHPLPMRKSLVWRAIEPIFGKPRAELLPCLEELDFGHGIREIFRKVPRAAGSCAGMTEPLMISETYDALVQMASISGFGSNSQREVILRELLCRAHADEAMYIVNNLLGETQTVISDEEVMQGLALASSAEMALIRRCYMRIGDIGVLADLAINQGSSALESIELTLFTPVRPMLAQDITDVSAAWVKQGDHLALEYQLDGARVQIHRSNDQVRIFTRHLMEITASLPEVVDAVRANVNAESAILEGEVVAMQEDGRSLPYQELMRRFRKVRDVPRLLKEIPIKLFLFDLLYQDGEPIIELPNSERWTRLSQVVREEGIVALTPRIVPGTVEESVGFFDEAIGKGHRGLISKRLTSSYSPGVRGTAWLKVREALTLNLVIIAAEWGYGEQAGWLSNYHLAARDIVTNKLIPVGRTSKPLTDQEFSEMEKTLLEQQTDLHEKVICMRPEVMVEVAFNQIQRSTEYPGGLALRFARILRFLPERNLDEIDTLQTLRDIYAMESGEPWAEAA
ncbi:MAG: ATP-dependent DNA ligase [Armatimonadota bacterium]